MRLSPTTPRELGINYISQWRDSVIYLDADTGIEWVDSTYPYSRSDLRALFVYNDGSSPMALLSEDGIALATEDGLALIGG